MIVNSLSIVIISLIFYLLAYLLYAKYLSKNVFMLNNKNKTPANLMTDGIDYVPAKTSVLWGHHFASIAGLAPMLGPAIAVIWGWLPAVLWIVFGTIIIGGVHDFGTLVISERNKGLSIGTLSEKIITPWVKIPFLIISLFLLGLAMGVFAYIVGLLFTSTFYPESVLPVFSIMIIAVVIGILNYKYKINMLILTILGVGLMLLSIWIGTKNPLYLEKSFLSKNAKEIISADYDKMDYKKVREHIFSGPKEYTLKSTSIRTRNKRTISTVETQKNILKKEIKSAASKGASTWIYILLFYAFIASVLPVWILLQPRDYINSFLLYIGMALMYIGLFFLQPYIVAPAIRLSTVDTPLPSLFPLLFITIACGAISGFHSLVSSGTTAKQLNKESDAKPIAYGGMIAEGMLALISVMAVTAGAFANKAEFLNYYSNWQTANSLGMKLNAFIKGGGNFLHSVGIGGLYIPIDIGTIFIAVMAISFAMTTLDSGTRLLRFNIEELLSFAKNKIFHNRYFTGIIAVSIIGFFALMKIKVSSGATVIYKPAGLLLWQLFGITNQILALLGLLVITFYLLYKKRAYWISGVPAIFMGIVTIAALVNKLLSFYKNAHYTLLIVGGLIFIILTWIIIASLIIFIKAIFQKKDNPV